MSFTQAQVDLLDANRELVECKRLFKVQFASETFRLIEDVIPRQVGGEEWLQGAGWLYAEPVRRENPLEAVAAIYRVTALEAQVTDTLQAAYDDLVMMSLHGESEWRNAPIQQSLQLFSDGVPVGPMISLHRGFIADVTHFEEPDRQYIEIRAETVFSRRNWTPLGEYTDRDQQRRHPGDKGCEFVPTFKDKVIRGWLRG